MVSMWALTAIGAAAGAVVAGALAAAQGDPSGLATALQHIPPDAHGHAVVTAVQSALAGGAAGGGIGASVSAAAKAMSGA